MSPLLKARLVQRFASEPEDLSDLTEMKQRARGHNVSPKFAAVYDVSFDITTHADNTLPVTRSDVTTWAVLTVATRPGSLLDLLARLALAASSSFAL